jgi:hypothetical protein
MAQNTSAAPKQVSDGNTQGLVLCPAKDSSGASYKLSAYGAAPVTQPTAAANVHTVAAGATTSVFVNTTFDGSIGSTAYTIGDIVAALKSLGLIAS